MYLHVLISRAVVPHIHRFVSLRVQQTSYFNTLSFKVFCPRAPDDTEFIVGTHWLLPPDKNDAHTREIKERMRRELDVGRADSIRSWMWVAGCGCWVQTYSSSPSQCSHAPRGHSHGKLRSPPHLEWHWHLCKTNSSL